MSTRHEPTTKTQCQAMRRLRLRAERTQVEAAAFAGLPLDVYCRLEQGKVELRLHQIPAVAAGLNASVGEFLEALGLTGPIERGGWSLIDRLLDLYDGDTTAAARDYEYLKPLSEEAQRHMLGQIAIAQGLHPSRRPGRPPRIAGGAQPISA